MTEQEQPQTVYDEIGGEETLSKLVHEFYSRVVRDEKLAPLFAGSDIDEVKQKQKMFLTQFFGGPLLYSEKFGHPMMRYRHLPFPITPSHAQAWLGCMSAAMDDVGLKGPVRQLIFGRLTQVAHHMVNTEESSLG